MSAETEKKPPAQVPGDAESPPQSESDETAAKSIRHTDKTEPVQSDRKERK